MVFAAVVAYVLENEGTILDDVTELLVPLGIAGCLLLLPLYVRQHDVDPAQLERIVTYGWFGALVATAVDGWWLLLHLLDELPMGTLSNQLVTVWSLGIGGGLLIGTYTVRRQESDRRSGPTSTEPQTELGGIHTAARGAGRETVLTESTWTDHASSTPILDAIVEELADIEGVEQFELDPLYEQIDPKVFDYLRTQGDTHWQLRFRIDDYELLISSHGTFTIYEAPHRLRTA